MASVTKDSTIRVGERSKFSIYATSGRVITYLLVSINTAGGIVTLFDSSGAIMSSTPNLATVSGTISATLSGTIVWVIKETGNIDVTTSTTTCYGIDTTWVSQQIGMWSNDVGTLCKGIDINGNQKINKWSKFKPVRNPNIQIGGSNIWTAGADAEFLAFGAGMDLFTDTVKPLGPGTGLLLNLTAVNGIVTAITINNGGSNYNVGDIVKIIGTAQGAGALAEITSVATGVVTGVELISGGNSYITQSAAATQIKPIGGTRVGRTVVAGEGSGARRSFYKPGAPQGYTDSALQVLSNPAIFSWNYLQPRGKTPVDHNEVYRLGDYRGYTNNTPDCYMSYTNGPILIQINPNGTSTTTGGESFTFIDSTDPSVIKLSSILLQGPNNTSYNIQDLYLTCVTATQLNPVSGVFAKSFGTMQNNITIDLSDRPGISWDNNHNQFGSEVLLHRWYFMTHLAIPNNTGQFEGQIGNNTGWIPYDTYKVTASGDPGYIPSLDSICLVPGDFTYNSVAYGGLVNPFFFAYELPTSSQSLKAKSYRNSAIRQFTSTTVTVTNNTAAAGSIIINIIDKFYSTEWIPKSYEFSLAIGGSSAATVFERLQSANGSAATVLPTYTAIDIIKTNIGQDVVIWTNTTTSTSYAFLPDNADSGKIRIENLFLALGTNYANWRNFLNTLEIKTNKYTLYYLLNTGGTIGIRIQYASDADWSTYIYTNSNLTQTGASTRLEIPVNMYPNTEYRIIFFSVGTPINDTITYDFLVSTGLPASIINRGRGTIIPINSSNAVYYVEAVVKGTFTYDPLREISLFLRT